MTDEEKQDINTSRLRIKIKAYDTYLVDSSAKQIVDVALRAGVKVIGPIPLPTEIKKFTVNRSTFIHKDAREQFEIRIHKRIIDIINPTKAIIENLQNLNLSTGVDIEIKM